MKIFFAFIILYLFLANPKNNSLQEDGLNGKIKSITEYQYSGHNDFRCKSYYLFDKIGNIIERKDSFGGDGTFNGDFKYEYQYNKDGNKIEQKDYNKDGTLSWRTSFIYDDNDHLIETNRYKANGDFMEKVMLKYDSLGNNVERNSYEGGVLNGKGIFRFDEYGHVVDCESIGNGSIDKYKKSSHEQWKYNASGHLYEYVRYEGEYLLVAEKYYDFKYDKSDNWIQRTSAIHKASISRDDTEITIRKIVYY